MSNSVFYVKFQENKAVAIRTETFVSATGRFVQNLFTVFDLIAAIRNPGIQLQVGLPKDAGPLSLSYHDTPDEEIDDDELLSALTGGRKRNEPLLIHGIYYYA